MWGMRTETVPDIVGTLGLREGTDQNSGKIHRASNINELQKITLLRTAHIWEGFCPSRTRLPLYLRTKDRVLKCDVIKMNFWNYGICQDILKEQCPRGLLAKNEHFGANCLWDRNPVMLRKLHTNPSKFFWVDPPKKFEAFVWSFLSITG